jgi:hypothetical protein
MWVKDDCIDKETLYVNSNCYQPLARLHGDFYIEAKHLIEWPMPTYEEWLERKKGQSS